jgi:phosphocarrier protein HPr
MYMIRENLQVINQLGIHARPAQHIVKVAARFRSELWLEKEGNRVNGKSIMGVLLLEAESGSPVTVEVDGPDETDLLAALRQLFLDRFHEE